MDTSTLVNRRTRRTTLTLEADVAEYVEERLAKDRRLKEKTLINDLIRKGIDAGEAAQSRPFKITPFKTRLTRGMTTERLEELIREI